jgi:hypothetical protein
MVISSGLENRIKEYVFFLKDILYLGVGPLCGHPYPTHFYIKDIFE